jgi:hypothetical protein
VLVLARKTLAFGKEGELHMVRGRAQALWNSSRYITDNLHVWIDALREWRRRRRRRRKMKDELTLPVAQKMPILIKLYFVYYAYKVLHSEMFSVLADYHFITISAIY